METLPPEPIPPVRLDKLVPGSLSVRANPCKPNEMILKAQVNLAPSPDLFTVVLHLARADAQRLATQLQNQLSTDSPRPEPA